MQLANTVYPEFRNGQMKWLASDVLSAGGQPQVGNVWYVDAVAGSDTANSGTAWNNAFKTLYAAHNAAVSNNYDVIVVAPSGTGTGSGTNESVYGAWVFSKNLITVIGAAAPTGISPRARILWNTASQSTTVGLLTISGSGNSFINIQLGTFVNNYILAQVTGSRNYFNGVHFAGIGDATAGAQAGATSLYLNGGSENTFDSCVIGLDTVARSTSNAEITLDSSAARNQFNGCTILTYASNSGHFFVKANAATTAIDRFVSFNNCGFINPVNSAATTMTDAMGLAASLSGSVIINNSYEVGATGWADNLTSVQALSVSSNSTYNQGIGKPVNPAA